MASDGTSPPLTEQHVSTRVMQPLWLELRYTYGEAKADEVIRASGLSPEYLQDLDRWVSLDFTLNWVREVARRFHGLDELPSPEHPMWQFYRLAGRRSLDREVLGPLFPLVRILGSPRYLLRQLPTHASRINRVTGFRVEEERSGLAVIFAWPQHGEDTMAFCMSRRGYLEAVPTVWNMPPALVEHPQCMHDPDNPSELCVYHVRYRSLPPWWIPGLISAGIGCSLMCATSAVFMNDLLPMHAAALVGAGVGLGLSGWWYQVRNLLQQERDSGYYKDLLEAHDKRWMNLRESELLLESRVYERTEALESAALREKTARDRLAAVLSSVNLGLVVVDRGGATVLMNRAAEDLLGVRLSRVQGARLESALSEGPLRDLIRSLVLEQPDREKLDVLHEMDGREIVLRIRASKIKNAAGVGAGMVLLFEDTTREREIDRMKTEFISTAAHELRTPLTSIRGFSELLMTRDDFTDDERRQYLRFINRESVSLSLIVSELLDLARLEAGKGLELDLEDLEPAAVLRASLERMSPLLGGRRVDVDLVPAERPIQADPEKLSQILHNLLSNAVKYSEPGKPIRIRGRSGSEMWELVIEDEGIGLTPEQQAHVFDRFYRADSSTRAVEGTGLGLSIVKHIVEAHGGTVRVESERGVGTSVFVALPFSSTLE